MPDATELMKLIKKSVLEAVMASDPVKILFGKVTGVGPLKIDVEQKMKLGESQLILCRNVTDFETEVSVDTDTDKALGAHSHNLTLELQEAGEPLHVHNASSSAGAENLEHTHSIKKRMKVTVHNRLAIGDKVILLRDQGGQKYLVVDRIG